MKAEIISIGTELIIGHTVNTNATYLSEKLNEIGIGVHFHTSVGDNKQRILQCLDIASKRSDLIITTGGLGPTDDDITHDVLAEFLNSPLDIDNHEKNTLEEKFRRYGSGKIPQINYRQARIIIGAEVIENPIGTAIGMYITKNNVTFATFPGVPCEMEAMLEWVLTKINSNNKTIVSKKIRLTDITESAMAEAIVEHYQKQKNINPFLEANPSLAPYASLGEVYLRVTAQAENKTKADALISDLDQELHKIFPKNIFGYDDDTLHSVLAGELKEKNLTISFAESCTGGFASKLLTDIPGASEYTKINLVAYADSAKEKFLGVSKNTLEKYGAVSLPCAQEMAEGLARISGADINVSITGIAGPNGGSNEKPIGTVFVGIVIKDKLVFCDKLEWRSRRLSRDQIRELTCKKVFWLLIGLV